MQLTLIAAVAGLQLLASVSVAQPVCGNKACKEEIDGCVTAECGGLSGGELSRCKRACKDLITAACELDPAICNPAPTTTTTTQQPTTTQEPTTTTSSTTTTTVVGSPSGVFLE